MKKLIIFLICLMMIPFAFAFDVSLTDGADYRPGDTITAAITATANPEKGDAYTAEWYNSSGYVFQFNVGFLSIGAIGTPVFEVYITSASTNLTDAYINVTTSGVSILRYFNVTGDATNILLITDARFSPVAKLGASFAVDFGVTDDLGNEIDNARCSVYGTDANDAPLQECTVGSTYSRTIDGRGVCAGILDPIPFEEGSEYIAKIKCSCGIGDNACFDENGVTVEKHRGGISFVFEVTPWLTVNTITDMNAYEIDDTIYVCANVTNLGDTRAGLDINYDYRCQDENGNLATDRILLGSKTERRGVNPNTTQHQCNSFLLVDDNAIERGAVNCYGATSVSVLDKNNHILTTYETTSSIFIIKVDEINPFIRWTRNSREVYSGKINLTKFNVGVKDIDVRINPRLTGDGTPGTMLKDWTVTYWNGTASPYETEIQIVQTAITDNSLGTLGIEKFDEMTITIKGVDTGANESFNVTIQGLELEFELIEDVNYEIVQTDNFLSRIWNYVARYIHGEAV